MLKDGFLITSVIVIWELPGSVLAAIPFTPVAVLGDLWNLLVLTGLVALMSQYLQGGFKAAFNIPALFRRLELNPGLTLLTGALVVSLSFSALLGIVLLIVGVLVTIPYASLVGAYLSGVYARLTDPPMPGQPELVLRSSISQA
jgi:hypothetical protein